MIATLVQDKSAEEKGHVSLENLEDIFATEGWIHGMGSIAENVRFVEKKAVAVYPQDVLDAVRYVVQNKIVQKGAEYLLKEQELVEVRYRFPARNHINQGRFVPTMELGLHKGSIADKQTFYGRLCYRDNPNYFIFAQFDVPTLFVKKLKEQQEVDRDAHLI